MSFEFKDQRAIERLTPVEQRLRQSRAEPTASHATPPPHKRRRKPSRWQLLLIGCVISAVLVGLGLVIFHKAKPSHPVPANLNQHISTTDKTYRISDDTRGLKFDITKDFNPISDNDLKRLNPYFVYGFQPADVANVQCIVSQTPVQKSAMITGPQLRDGTFQVIQKQFPDAKIEAYQAIGTKNNHDAISMDISYQDNGVAIKRLEVVAATDKQTSFAYCNSPQSLFSYYKTRFVDFFSSLEVY